MKPPLSSLLRSLTHFICLCLLTFLLQACVTSATTLTTPTYPVPPKPAPPAPPVHSQTAISPAPVAANVTPAAPAPTTVSPAPLAEVQRAAAAFVPSSMASRGPSEVKSVYGQFAGIDQAAAALTAQLKANTEKADALKARMEKIANEFESLLVAQARINRPLTDLDLAQLDLKELEAIAQARSVTSELESLNHVTRTNLTALQDLQSEYQEVSQSLNAKRAKAEQLAQLKGVAPSQVTVGLTPKEAAVVLRSAISNRQNDLHQRSTTVTLSVLQQLIDSVSRDQVELEQELIPRSESNAEELVMLNRVLLTFQADLAIIGASRGAATSLSQTHQAAREAVNAATAGTSWVNRLISWLRFNAGLDKPTPSADQPTLHVE